MHAGGLAWHLCMAVQLCCVVGESADGWQCVCGGLRSLLVLLTSYAVHVSRQIWPDEAALLQSTNNYMLM